MPFRTSQDGVTVALRVTPKASANRVHGVAVEADGASVLKVAVTAAPRDGKANAALIRLLAKAWKFPKTSLSVTSGAISRRKVVHIAGEPGALLARLRAWERARK